jgi:hypothetical protein
MTLLGANLAVAPLTAIFHRHLAATGTIANRFY